MTAPCPAKMPRVGKVTAVVKPAPRAVSMRWSVAEISSAILIQLVVWGRSSGPRAGAAAALGGGRGGWRRGLRWWFRVRRVRRLQWRRERTLRRACPKC